MVDPKLWRDVHRVVKELAGTPFAHDSNPPKSFNCITLLTYCFSQLGWHVPWRELDKEMEFSKLPRFWFEKEGARNYYMEGFQVVGDKVPLEEAFAGDIFLFGLESKKLITHAGLVVDGAQFFHVRERMLGAEVSRLHGVFRQAYMHTFRVKPEYRG